jgi:hypothetical protein
MFDNPTIVEEAENESSPIKLPFRPSTNLEISTDLHDDDQSQSPASLFL